MFFAAQEADVQGLSDMCSCALNLALWWMESVRMLKLVVGVTKEMTGATRLPCSLSTLAPVLGGTEGAPAILRVASLVREGTKYSM